ncbi:zinc transporter ZIP1 [Xyrichtys novacula]|uniref:Zinc transporter ZIP1 n=1 Tax=Xyrichtys novacula TaxID=13765 RepID=A0AAV1ELA0_XYRNO|nr:zinc transporter ZIP1 [Xyrichtys novacula]
MDYLLAVKVGSLFGLLFLTLLFGFIPARVLWFRDSNATETQRTVLSLISCFAGGVFLAACLLDIIPTYLEDMSNELDVRQVETNFPLPEFIMAIGFFTVLIVERMVLNCRGIRGTQEERAPLIQDNRNGHGHGLAHNHPADPDIESSSQHVHVDFHAHSPFRSFMLFLSLSVHSIFEGLAIGLQNTDSKVLELCVAILIHKSIIVFSLSVKLVQSAVTPLWVAAYIGVFAMMSPIGIAIGISVMEAGLAAGALIQAILEGLAAGTFVYITFMEILPHELNSPGRQLIKVLFILLGFSVMATLTFLG